MTHKLTVFQCLCLHQLSSQVSTMFQLLTKKYIIITCLFTFVIIDKFSRSPHCFSLHPPLSPKQNTIEIIVIGIINILLLLFALIQIFQSTKWINRVNGQLDQDRLVSPTFKFPDKIPKTVISFEVVLVLVLLVFAAASVYLGYRLYRQFGWNIYKKIGANIQMQSK